MYQALYRTERPEDFSRVLGQEHIVRILKNQIRNGTTTHAYLFCGTRGTGKTSLARILTKAVNCTGEGEKPCCRCANCRAIREGNFMDMIEIDAASNNGVDNVRELRESVNYPPVQGRKKVYIIDEVHMLSPAAFNALLKTLEEPPDNVMFILATTDPQKLPATILSRCLRMDFHRIPARALAERMGEICRARGVEVTDEALQILAAAADGSARDGLSILDQCLAGSDKVLDAGDVIEYLGSAPTGFFMDLTDCVTKGDAAGALVMLDRILREGKDVKQLMADWLAHYRSLLIAKYVREPGEMLGVSAEKGQKLAEQSRGISLRDLNRAIVMVAKVLNDARYSTQPRVLMELAIVTLAGGEGTAPETKPQRQAASPAANHEAAPVRKPAEPRPAEPEPAARPAEPEPVREAPVVDAELPWNEPGRTAGQEKNPESERTAGHEEATEPEMAPEPEMKTSASPAEIWERIWDFIPDGGSLYMLRGNSRLAYIDDKIMEIQVDGDILYQIAERNQQVFSDAAREVIGAGPRVILKRAPKQAPAQMSFVDLSEGADEGADGGQPDDLEAIAKALEEKLHIKPTIEK
ncbi:MAG: DNA polymerase III subunit gamma/tau [Firmicutes bacterium]|nr:DNA polymerase III subunit gamma/tau [Bacillota bacterium]